MGLVPSDPRGSLIELRVLDGANLYFPRPVVKLTLDLSGLLDMSEPDAEAVVEQLDLPLAPVGSTGSSIRQGFAATVVAHLAQRVAAASGTAHLALRCRPAPDLARLVVAYPWRRRGRAEALGRALGAVLDELPTADLAGAVRRAASTVRAAPPVGGTGDGTGDGAGDGTGPAESPPAAG
jgi:cyanophycin synthetase